jgi:hypothetical protein
MFPVRRCYLGTVLQERFDGACGQQLLLPEGLFVLLWCDVWWVDWRLVLL